MQFLIRTSRVMRTQVYALLFLTIFFVSVCVFHMQLYELDSDQKRKEFLDNLFSFMQKRGIYKEITFYILRHVRMSSYRDLYDPWAFQTLPHRDHINTQLIFHISMCMCIYIGALQFPLFISCWSRAVAPTITCVFINVGVQTYVHVMIWPWD